MATYPPGISLATVSAGSTTDFFGNEATITVDVTPVLDGAAVHLTHAASGQTMVIATRRFTSDLGSDVTFQVPHVDQSGWIDSSGQAITHWAYRVDVTALFDTGARHKWTKTFQPIMGQSTVDVDLVSDGAVYDPRFSPIPSVISVNGQTGVIQVGELVGPTGNTGPAGPANTLSIGSVTARPAGQQPTASITGTAPNQALHLGLPTGAAGPAGPAGADGPVGPQGEPGGPGPAGPASSLTVGTVSTGAAGSSALVSITGTAPNQALNVTIPRGNTGAAGPAGPAGSAGPAGPAGATGPANTLAIGTVTTAVSGGSAAASITGTSPNQTLHLTLPRGPKGDPGTGGGGGSLPWFDATAYGADKTGTNDSAAAINDAVAAANAAGGGIVYLPAGEYRIEYSANAGGTGVAGGIQMRGNVWLKGDGRGTRLFPTGTWNKLAGIIGIGDSTTTRGSNTMYNVRVSDMFIKGEKGPLSGGTKRTNTAAILFNTYNGSGPLEPDAAHVVHDLLIWDMDMGMMFIGEDDQGMSIQRIRIRRCLRACVQVGKSDGSGGGPDNYFFNIDASSANSAHLGNAVFEIYAANVHMISCKAWYAKRSTAFSSASTYLDGAGFYIAGTRNTFISCEAQDNGGHGFILRYGYNALVGCIADSNSYYDCVSGAAATNECSGVFITGGASNSTVDGLITFNRSSAHRDQKYGVLINSSVRAISVSGTGYDNASTSGGGAAADAVSWTTTRNVTHRVEVTTSYADSGYDVIANPADGTSTGGGGTTSDVLEVTKIASADRNVVLGTTLVDDARLKISGIAGGAKRYKVEAQIMYRANADRDGQLGLRPAIIGGTGTFEVLGAWEHSNLDGAYARTTAYSTASSAWPGYASVEGAGHTGNSTYRTASFSGSLYAGSSITSGSLAVCIAELSGTSADGIVIAEGSWLRITPSV